MSENDVAPFSTHNAVSVVPPEASAAKMADTILVLEQGRIEETVEEAKKEGSHKKREGSGKKAEGSH